MSILDDVSPGSTYMPSALDYNPRGKYKDALGFYEAVRSYFEWCTMNPLKVPINRFDKELEVSYIEWQAKLRPFTRQGLCLHIGIGTGTWKRWLDDRPELASTMEWAENMIFEQQYSHAAVDTFSGALVARYLGLADKKVVDIPPPDNPVINLDGLSLEEQKILLKALKRESANGDEQVPAIG